MSDPLSDAHRANFDTIKRAFADGNALLLACTDVETGETVPVICAVQMSDERTIEMVPLARLFIGNPYDEVKPPK